MTKRVGLAVFSAAACVLLSGLISASALADDPVEWRDNRDRNLRNGWSKLESKPAPSMEALKGPAAPGSRIS
jgi:hypothetical protein